MRSFADKVAAITGAGSGIGRALALAAAKRGCGVALADIDGASLAETVTQVRAVASVRVTHTTFDVADRAAMFAWAEAVVAEHGRCNLIFNNAGIGLAASVA